MEEFSSYFKYCSDSKDVLNGIFKNHKIRLTQPWGMNDPLEFNPTLKFPPDTEIYQFYELNGITLPSIELFYRVQIIESQINSYGILSLTKLPFSFEMWSKYTNGHKGFVIELDNNFSKHPCMKSKSGTEYSVKKVEYVDDYSLVIDSILNNDRSIIIEKLRDELFFKKTSIWSNEAEYRLVRPFSDLQDYKPIANKPHRDDKIHLFDFSLDCVKSVMFGACMSAENKKMIIAECSNYDIDIFQSYIIRNKPNNQKEFNNVQIVNIKDFDSLEELYSLKPYFFIKDAPEQKTSPSFKIKAIEDLPYFDGNEKITNELYKNLMDNSKDNLISQG
ncbi:MAG: DUF2971 domain-containing protein [Anaerolineales bacterium]|nr:DUF2971 domain-containing protein [Anaerolineales bacterium]